MRSRLVIGAFAMTCMVALAFAIPLGLLNQRYARERAAEGWLLIGALVVLLVAGCVIAADRFGKRWHSDREFAADLSHRLRTPLTALQLDVDALPDGPDADRMRDAIAALDSEIDAVIAESRRTPEQRAGEESDVVDVLADRLAFWAVLAEDHGRPWQLSGEQERLMVRVSRADLISAVDALLGNVFRHTPQGTAFRVEVAGNALTVEDAGPGIADPHTSMQRGASGVGSTGLGLSIVHKVGKVRIGKSALGGAKIMVVFEHAV